MSKFVPVRIFLRIEKHNLYIKMERVFVFFSRKPGDEGSEITPDATWFIYPSAAARPRRLVSQYFDPQMKVRFRRALDRLAPLFALDVEGEHTIGGHARSQFFGFGEEVHNTVYSSIGAIKIMETDGG